MIERLRMYRRMFGLRGYLCAIAAKFTNSMVCCTVKRPDCKYPFQVRIPSSDIPTYRQVFNNQDYDFLSVVQPKVIVDAGANIGLASLYFANKFPDAKIIAVEPEQSNFELLQKNSAPYQNIIPLQAALWHKNDEINVTDPGEGKWAFRTEMKNSQEKLSGKTAGQHMSFCCRNDRRQDHAGLQPYEIDVLKVDIEGAEREVFSDSSAWLEKVDAIIIELHDRLKAGCSRSFYLGSFGFDAEWRRGENVFVSRRGCLKRGSA